MELLQYSWLLLLVDTSVKSLGLATLAGIGLATFRVRNPNIKHRVWTSVLIAMLTLPLLGRLTPGIVFPVTAIWPVDAAPPELPAEAFPIAQASSLPSSQVPVQREDDSEFILNSLDWSIVSSMESQDVVELMDPPNQSATALPSASNSVWQVFSEWSSRHWSLGIIGTYFAISFAFGVRVVTGLWGVHRLVGRARAVTSLQQESTKTPFSPRISICESDELQVPLTVGFLRPKILLPSNWGTWNDLKLHAVLAHENEHVARWDYLVGVVAELNRSVHWFNPVAWFLRRRLSELAEQNCDDAVIASTGERVQYARHLLEVASVLREGRRMHVSWAGVAMARRPNVESRIDSILDAKRPLARRLGVLGGLILMVCVVPAVLVAAALRPGADENASGASIEADVESGKIIATQEVDSSPTGTQFLAGVEEWTPIGAPGERIEQAATPTLTRLHGQVLRPDGQGQSATIHVISKKANAWMQRGIERILQSIDTDELGNFDFEVTLPARDPNINMGIAQARVEQIIATSPGCGFAISNLIAAREGNSIKLTLPKAGIPIEGRILNLEGEPVVGAQLEIALLKPVIDIDKHLEELRRRSQEKPNNMMASFVAISDFMGVEIDPFANERIAANQLDHSTLLPKRVTTDHDGRFRIEGIAEDRLLALSLSGPGIVKSWISVVSRDMQPIRASLFVASHTNMTYGAKFSYSAEPSQPIQGYVRDAETNDPISGVRIATRHHDAANVSVTTDDKGFYRLDGIPKKKSHSLAVTPPADAPYFVRDQLTINNVADGLEPTQFDLQLRKSKWVTGTVTDARTGDPVSSARVMYTPHANNAEAKRYGAFSRVSYLDPFNTNRGAVTNDDGRFRVRAVEGEGLLAVRSRGQGYCLSRADELPENWLLPGERTTNTRDSLMPEWMHALTTISLTDDASKNVDIQLDPGKTMRLTMVDSQDRPLTGVHALGRQPGRMDLGRPVRGNVVFVQAIDAQRPRPVYLYHRKTQSGAAFVVGKDAIPSRRIQLQKCGTVKGRLLDKEGNPLANHPIIMKPHEVPEHHQHFATTDKDGNFESDRVFSGFPFQLFGGYGPREKNLGTKFELLPGQVLSLGDIQLDGQTKQAGSFTALTAATPQPNQTRKDTADKEHLTYAGRVVLPNGSPAANAKIYLNYWQMTPLRRVPVKPVAMTDQQGRFEFQRSWSEIDRESIGAHLVATLDGYGFATAFAPSFERSGRLVHRLKQSEGYSEFAEALVQRDKGPLQLSADVGSIRGRVVDSEGNGVANVQVAIVEVLASIDGTSNTWDQAVKNPKVDHHTITNSFRRQLRGPKVPETFGIATTNAQGRFTLSGLGPHRVAKLAVQGKNVEAIEIYARTDPGKAVQFSSHGNPSQSHVTFHANEFTIVANPARPVVGRVTDAQTGEPVAGAVINSTLSWTSSFNGDKPIRQKAGNNVAYAVSKDDGTFRLDGLPNAKFSIIRAIGVGTSYLAKTDHVDTSGRGVKPVTHDFKLDKGMIIEGRVTDAETGEGVEGYIEFFPKGSQGRMVTMFGAEGPKRSGRDGRFRVLVPQQDGSLCFTAFERHMYKISPMATSNDTEIVASQPSMLAFRAQTGFHASEFIKSSGEKVQPVRWIVSRTQVTKGHAEDADGNPVSKLKYVGHAAGIPRWSPSAEGTIRIFGLNESRRIAVICEERELAGTLVINESTRDFVVKLQPWATLKGRIVDEDGEPLAGTQLMPGSVFGQPLPGGSSELPVNVQAYEQTLPLPPVQIGLMTKYQHDVGPDGQFEIKGLIPGYNYAIAGLNNVDPVRAYSNDLVKGMKLASGEVRDLGDVVLRPPTPAELKARSLSAPPPRALSPQREKSPKPPTTAR